MSSESEVGVSEDATKEVSTRVRKEFDAATRSKGDAFMTAANAVYNGLEGANAADFAYCLLTSLSARFKAMSPKADTSNEETSEGVDESTQPKREWKPESLEKVRAIIDEQLPEGDTSLRLEDVEWIKIAWRSKLQKIKQNNKRKPRGGMQNTFKSSTFTAKHHNKNSHNENAASGETAPASKRSVCTHFKRTGNCNFGDSCRFSHDVPPPAPSATTTPATFTREGGPRNHHFNATNSYVFRQPTVKLCPYPLGYCKFGDACRYSHGGGGGRVVRPMTVSGVRGVCNAFRDTGSCKYGDACRYSHEQSA